MKFRDLSNDNCQLFIHRDGDLVYYSYVSYIQSCFIGICVIVNGITFTDFRSLMVAFEEAIESTFQQTNRLYRFDIALSHRIRRNLIRAVRQRLSMVGYRLLLPQKYNSDKDTVETIPFGATMRRLPAMTESSTVIISNISAKFALEHDRVEKGTILYGPGRTRFPSISTLNSKFIPSQQQPVQDDIFQSCLVRVFVFIMMIGILFAMIMIMIKLYL